MPSGTGKSNLLAGIANDVNKAHQQYKGKPTEYDTGGSLPAGIENGVAQLVDMKISVYKDGDNKGKPFFYAAGVIVSPTTHEGVTIEGRRTSIMEPLCATPQSKGKRKSLADHYGWVRNELCKFLGNPAKGISGESEFDKLKNPAVEIETVLIPALLKKKPHFEFRTWKGKATAQFPDPRTNEVWNGLVEYDPSKDGEAQEDAVVDSTEEDGPVDHVEDDDAPEDNNELSLGERADIEEGGGEDTGAIVELSKMAQDAGIDAEEYPDWVSVENAINEAQSEAPEEEAEAEEEAEEGSDPEKGQTVSYNRAADIAAQEDPDEFEDELTEMAEEAGIDPDTIPTWGELAEKLGKMKGATAEYEITFVSAGKRTVNLKGSDGNVIKGVSFDSLA